MPLPAAAPQEPRCSLHDWASLRSELLFVFDDVLPPESADNAGTRDDDFSAWLVRRGGVRLTSDGETREARAGQWIVCYGKRIRQHFEPGTALLSLRAVQGWPDGSRLFPDRTLYVLEAAAHPRLERLALPLLRAVERVPVWSASSTWVDPREVFLWRTRLDYAAYIRYERSLLAWLAELARALTAEGAVMHLPDKTDPRLAQASHLLDSLAPGSPFPKKELAAATGLGAGRLNRLFVQAYGCTPFGYWEQRRAERARRLVRTPSVRIKEAASELGFVQLSHFSAWFKRHTGLSPRAFRQEERE